MSWDCPHQIDDFCDLLKRKCKPGIKGCVLSGKVTFLKQVKMKAKIDAKLCINCGLCVDVCPAVFAMNDSAARVIVNEVPVNGFKTCKEAADSCPVEAISIEE